MLFHVYVLCSSLTFCVGAANFGYHIEYAYFCSQLQDAVSAMLVQTHAIGSCTSPDVQNRLAMVRTSPSKNIATRGIGF